MAKKNNEKKSSNNNSGKKSLFSVNKWSFWTLVAIVVLTLLATVFNFVDIANIGINLTNLFMSIANIFACAILSYSAWKFVRDKQTVWKVLYGLLLLAVVVLLILPIIKI